MNTGRTSKLIVVLVLAFVVGCSVSANSGSSGGSVDNGNTGPGLPAGSFRQNPSEITYDGCPPEGDGGDPILNKNKNRVDNGNYQATAFSTILNLTWPKETERRAHDTWSASAQTQVAQ